LERKRGNSRHPAFRMKVSGELKQLPCRRRARRTRGETSVKLGATMRTSATDTCKKAIIQRAVNIARPAARDLKLG